MLDTACKERRMAQYYLDFGGKVALVLRDGPINVGEVMINVVSNLQNCRETDIVFAVLGRLASGRKCTPFGSGTPLLQEKVRPRRSLQLQTPRVPHSAGLPMGEGGRNPLRQAGPTTHLRKGLRRRSETQATATRPAAALSPFLEIPRAEILGAY